MPHGQEKTCFRNNLAIASWPGSGLLDCGAALGQRAECGKHRKSQGQRTHRAMPPRCSLGSVDAELRQLYAVYAPAKLAALPALRQKYGAEELLSMARQKYAGIAGVAVSPVTPPTSPAGEPEARSPSQTVMEAAMMEASKLTALLALGATRRATTRAVRERTVLPLEDRPMDPLHCTICSGDTAAMRELHEGDSGPLDFRQPWCRRHPALVIEVVRRGHADMLGFMIAAAPELDLAVLTSTGRTLLMVAVHMGHYDAARVLLEKGQCTNTNVHSGFDSMTALHLCQQIPMARLLLHHGADWRLINARGHTVRESAAAATSWAVDRPLGAAPRSEAAMGASEEVAAWLRLLDDQGRAPIGFRRMPFIALHLLALAGRALLRPLSPAHAMSSAAPLQRGVGDGGDYLRTAGAARLHAALAFVFPGQEVAGLSLPTELLPLVVRALVSDTSR